MATFEFGRLGLPLGELTTLHQCTLPLSGLPYLLLGAGQPSGKFSSILRYTASGRTPSRMSSVNAGDPGLYVGGGTINEGFARQISDHEAYTMIHKQALLAARLGRAVKTSFHAGAPVRLVQVTRGANDPDRGPVSAGTVFLDVFSLQPHGVSENAAMLYLVPPNGRDFADPGHFLAAVSEAAQNVVASIASFNSGVSAGSSAYCGLGTLNELRTCLFSGGRFRHSQVSVAEVAKTIASGLDSAAAVRTTGLDLIEFENGTGEFADIKSADS